MWSVVDQAKAKINQATQSNTDEASSRVGLQRRLLPWKKNAKERVEPDTAPAHPGRAGKRHQHKQHSPLLKDEAVHRRRNLINEMVKFESIRHRGQGVVPYSSAVTREFRV